MGIGVSIFLLAVGAILKFALDVSISGVNLDVVGWILMAAGALGLIITTIIWGNHRGTAVTTEPAAYRRVSRNATTWRDRPCPDAISCGRAAKSPHGRS